MSPNKTFVFGKRRLGKEYISTLSFFAITEEKPTIIKSLENHLCFWSRPVSQLTASLISMEFKFRAVDDRSSSSERTIPGPHSSYLLFQFQEDEFNSLFLTKVDLVCFPNRTISCPNLGSLDAASMSLPEFVFKNKS